MTWIEKVSGDPPYYYNQLFTRMAGGGILKLNNKNNDFNSPYLTIELTKSLCTNRSSNWASIVKLLNHVTLQQ